MNAMNGVASNFLQRGGGINYSPGNYSMPHIDTNALINPVWKTAQTTTAPQGGAPAGASAAATTPSGGMLDANSVQAMIDADFLRRQQEEEERRRRER